MISASPCQSGSGDAVTVKSSEFVNNKTLLVSEKAKIFSTVPVSMSATSNEYV